MTRNKPRKSIRIEGLTLDVTSSLNKFYLCECGRKFFKKVPLQKHVTNCSGIAVIHACRWCKLEFNNRGNLVLHARLLHGDNSYQLQTNVKEKKFRCNACDNLSYDANWKLKYHIRKNHFNLWSATTHFESKQVNQVWFETVLNSTNVVEMTKIGPNTILIKRLAPDTQVKVSQQPSKIGLHSVYPCESQRKRECVCKICKRIVKTRDLKKHIQESHQQGFSKHVCNNCNMTFKRSYIYLKHVCNKIKKSRVKRVLADQTSSIRITNVSSLEPVEIESDCEIQLN